MIASYWGPSGWPPEVWGQLAGVIWRGPDPGDTLNDPIWAPYMAPIITSIITEIMCIIILPLRPIRGCTGDT